LFPTLPPDGAGHVLGVDAAQPMTPTELLAQRHRKHAAGPPGGRRGPVPAGWFHHSLRRERARSDRSGRTFALVVFTPREPGPAAGTHSQLVEILRRQLSPADEVGWFDEDRIAVILPDVTSEDGWKLVDEVCLAFPLDDPPPLGEVFLYPSQPITDVEDPDWPRNAASERPTRPLAGVFVRPLPWWKRMVDLLGASLGLIVLAPLMALCAMVIKLESRGPVLFRQLRTGRGGKPFVMYKFRSMRVDAEAEKTALLEFNEQDGPAFKIKNDPRLTRFGRWLRSTSVDELPQLWNVVKGEMTLVGPRPLPCDEADGCELWQRRRLDVTPGLTCIWQVRGRSRVSFDEWMRMDLQYIDSHSIGQDLTLLLATVGAVLRRTGA
jgi:lipopolysaccharide/colanic/teichoic acid biosynthesis glycosyltransferase